MQGRNYSSFVRINLDACQIFRLYFYLAQNVFLIYLFPGGHPHNWNAISKECLSLLADLTQRLVAYHDTVATNGRAKSLSSGSERKTSSETSGTLVSQKWLSMSANCITVY